MVHGKSDEQGSLLLFLFAVNGGNCVLGVLVMLLLIV